MASVMTSAASTAAVLALLGGISAASAQTLTFDFEDGTDQGFRPAFTDTDTVDFPVDTIDGSLRLGVQNDGDFQEGEFTAGGNTAPLVAAIEAAVADPTNYQLSFDYYVDTSATGTVGTFLQIGHYINEGDGTYLQNANIFELGGDSLASGSVFSDTYSATFASLGYTVAGGLDGSANDFYRLGIIVNGDGNEVVYFDNITIAPIPEPASLSLLGLGGLALLRRRR